MDESTEEDLKYNRNEIKQLYHKVRKILATYSQTPIPPPPLHKPSNSMKISKLDLPNWSGETYDLYTWVTHCETILTSTETKPTT